MGTEEISSWIQHLLNNNSPDENKNLRRNSFDSHTDVTESPAKSPHTIPGMHTEEWTL